MGICAVLKAASVVCPACSREAEKDWQFYYGAAADLPKSVIVRGRGFGSVIALFGASDLLAAQHGYSYNPVTQQEITDWNPAHVVIASKGGDPYVLDIGATRNGDCPVLTARHGEGEWNYALRSAMRSSRPFISPGLSRDTEKPAPSSTSVISSGGHSQSS